MTTDDAQATLNEPVEFEPRGYGSTCSACGALIVGVEAQRRHLRFHRAQAELAQR